MRLDRCVKEMFLFLKLLSFNRLLKVALVLLQKCTLSLLPSPWKVISGSKLPSQRSCWKVQNVLIRKLTPSHTNLAIVDGVRMCPWIYRQGWGGQQFLETRFVLLFFFFLLNLSWEENTDTSGAFYVCGALKRASGYCALGPCCSSGLAKTE